MIYRFEKFELDEERCELRRGRERLPIARKSFDVLRHLVHHAGRVVSKEELFALIWPGEHVNDHVLPVHIRTIRKLLGEPESGSLIRTVRGRGYSLVCAVEVEPVRSSVVAAQPESSGPFVGRAALLEQFQASLAAAASGRGRALVLQGDAGVGKTRALEELACRAARQGAILVQARGEPEPGAPPFWTLIDLFTSGRSALEAVAASAPAALESSELTRARRRLRTLFERQRAGGLDPQCARFEIGRAARELVAQVTRLAPLVVVIDDLHLIDEDSLAIWAAAVRRLHEQRVLMLSAYRSDALPVAAPLARVLGALATERAFEPLRLRGLDDEAVQELVRLQLGERPPSAFVRALQERTEGNPFFIRELLRELAEQGGASRATGWDLARAGLPSSAREAIERQLGRVSADCSQLLGWAAVIGRRFSFPLLEQVSGLDAARLLEQLREAAEARIIDYAGDGDLALGEYRFAYPWLREVLYARLSGPERVLRHRAVGAALEERHASDAELGELAHHFFQAAPGGDIDRAASYCAGAARRALAEFAFDDAVRHMQRALRAEELRTPPDRLRFCCVTLGLGDALRRAGRYEESRTRLLAAAQDARELGRDDLLAYCALALAKWPRFPGPKVPFQSGQAQSEGQRQEVLALVHEALARLDAAAQAEPRLCLRSRVLAVRARVEAESGRLGSAESLGEQALELARRSQNPRALFDALLARRVSLHVPQDAARALRTSNELVRTARTLRAQPLLFTAYAARIPALVALGAMSEASADLVELTAIADRLRAPEHAYTAACFELARALSEGQLALARSRLPRVRALGFAAGDLDVTWKNRMIKLWLLYAEGGSARVRTSVEALVDRMHVRAPGFHVFHADYWRGIGDARRAAAHFEQAAAENFDDFERDDDWLWDLSLSAHVCAYLGDKRRAQQLYERIAPFAKLNVTCSLYVYRGSAHFPLAMLATVLGDSALASEHFEAAIEFNRRIEARSALLFSEAQYGRALLRGGVDERARGTALLERVTREATEHGVLRLRRAAELHSEM